MPWDLLSRLWRPVHRQPTQPRPAQDITPQPQQELSAHQLPIDRKILQDPSSLLEAEEQPERALPLGLTPSTRVPSADGGRKARSHARPIDLSSEPLSEYDVLTAGSPVDISPRVPSRFTISRISKIAGGGEWSTFGRKRERQVPDILGVSGRTSPPDDRSASHSPSPTRDSKHLSADSMGSTFTLSRLANSSVAHGAHLSPGASPRQSLDMRLRSSLTDAMSCERHPRTPQRPSSCTTPVVAHAMSTTTPANRELVIDSPHTFGLPTPPDNRVEFSVASPSLPPPLPPLDHPELAAVLCLRRQSTSGQPALSAFRDRSNTLPANPTPSCKDDLFKSVSLKLRRSIRHRSSPPETKQVPIATTRLERRRRARTMSAGRRTSADWSSHQASVGVTLDANRAWPAEVSREMLRLSLPPRVSGSSVKRTRGESADPVRRSDQGATTPSLLPFPHPSRPDSPPPFTASATRAGGREVLPARSRSLQFNLGNHRGSQRSAAFTTTKVKRSASATESRNNEASGATYPSSGLSDPTQSQAPLLNPCSAPTPPALLSGRVSPAITSMASVQEEPSTPTPAPRHSSMSDKSRGKRKAEDNIDLTPPEHKKEGQHATFLLPSGTRSQRVSHSSHAPSSYHRKRARLSSTSPFTTPVQSRPSSVHETPKSASRNHHFSSLSSGTGARIAPPRTPSRAASTRSHQLPTPSTTRKHERHQSMSQVSIPISAIVSPHAPSISRSTKFHMRDPRRPPKKPNDTPWGLRFATEDEPGSPIQAWCFFLGFLLFPVWWIAGLLLHVPRTRIAGDVDTEKGVTIDDPQIEHDARIWRLRCRVMTVLSLFTYIPFIVLVAIFAPR